ncbi:TIGR04282 family arsenosugar biosynthesis glycosyltransferase [Acaryochloris sp. IP29b_bin.148]|uniref:TIGR04282 family arsenosugar biosynthesis glycosyltransferase n=1 Tax=Acaryochloris sp. IP29b_bin.148 TaxID=2969218 RepID=UPI00262D4167|nr:TIGR04282 family arsenosugar biosynthesis glycosyltransferase [Acaryochloris sp. IP29b_bin.148]
MTLSDRSSSSSSVCLLLFVKNPIPGTVKSRLGRVIGFAEAAALYRCFARDLLFTTQTLGLDQLIFFAPADAQPSVSDWLGADHQYFPQVGKDLGERMANAFTTSFQLGYRGALITGSDSPDLPLPYLEEGIQALQQQQIVIGSSDDGGYYTLGFTPENFTPAVFEGIPWSTETVFTQTLQLLPSQSVYQLPPWYDIDTVEDLRQFHQRFQHAQGPRESMAYLQQHHDCFGF